MNTGALHLTQKVDYGIMLLTSLANAGKKSVSIRKISEENDLSFLFLQKIAGILKQAGIISAGRGKYGGYILTKSPSHLKLKEIIEALEGPIAIVPCLKSSLRPCSCSQSCGVKSGLKKLNDEIMECFSSKSLSYFLKSK
ncbi:MAG: Rrf2 family transcriptional regulator [Candidatus Peregrinibacteria bacterium]